MGLFYKNNGTISVFLCLILLPFILVGGMTVDASRIALSKVVISDAGEMAMNAGLAQYNEELHDEYGLLVMDQSPEAMSGELADYFNASLNGTGLPDEDDYQKILDLLTENFEAVNVAGSEIYRTEVEKQQIIEYMKYRAPICLTEMIFEKIGMLEDTELMVETMDAQLDFSEAMEDCQDAFQDALDALNTLNQAIESFPSEDTIRKELENTEQDYKGTVSRCLLMREVIQNYQERSQSTDLKAMAEGYVGAAKKVDLSSPESSVTFNAYMDAMYYENSVSHLGGIDKLLQDYDDAKAEAEEGEETTTETVDKDREELQKIVNDYKMQKDRIAGYATTLLTKATEKVNIHYDALNGYREAAKTAENAAKKAYDKLEKVQEKLNEAKDKFSVWDGKYEELSSAGKAGDMDEQVEYYREFFFSTDGEGKSDMENLEDLMAVVASNEGFFTDLQDVLKNEKFFGKSIASDSPSGQLNKYMSEAKTAVGSINADYSSVESARNGFISNYEHVDVSTSHRKQSISNDPFYKKLQEYCAEGTGNGDPAAQNAANEDLNKSKDAGKEMSSTEGYPTFNWGAAGVTLPSSVEGASVRDADSNLTGLDVNANVSSSSARNSTITEFKESIHAASSFLDKVDEIVAKGAENLYIAEYAMQMFSYYTIDKEDGKDRLQEDIISLSGYSFTDREAYRGEVEYILWGNSSSEKNVGNTVMMIFGIRLLLNSFYAFTDARINSAATLAAHAIAAGTPYLIPIIRAVIKFGYAGVETLDDITKLKQGYGVTVIKSKSTWVTGPENVVDASQDPDNTKGVTLDYSEYLRIFLNVSILCGHKANILSRIADCIQVDKKDINLLTSYTMIQVDADVSTRTTFMRKISDFGGGGWGVPDDTYSIEYQSVLGY